MRLFAIFIILFGHFAFANPIRSSAAVMEVEKSDGATCTYSRQSMYFSRSIQIGGEEWDFKQVEDITTEEQASSGTMQLELTLAHIANPTRQAKALLSLAAPASTIRELREHLSKGKWIYVTSDTQCMGVRPNGPDIFWIEGLELRLL